MENELLRKIICGAKTKGDSVVNILLPDSEYLNPDIENADKLYPYYFLRLFSKQANDLALVETDLNGPAFLLAFLEVLPFASPDNKYECMKRMMTLPPFVNAAYN